MKNYYYFYFLCLAFLYSNLLNAQSAGILDTSFGNQGYAVVDVVPNEVDLSEDVVVCPDSKILMVGKVRRNNYFDVCLVRLLPDGNIDTDFGNQGIVITSASDESDFGMAVALQDDGKIVVAGYAMHDHYDMMVMRYNEDGSLDDTFGDNGIASLSIDNKSSVAETVAIQEDGKILIGCYASSDRFCVVRFNTDGSLDNAFGTNGYALYEPDYLSYIHSMDIQSDGKIIAAGVGYMDNLPSFMIVRFNTDGSVDNSFGDNGKVKQHIGYGNDFANAVKVLDNGNILVGGHTWIANVPILQYDLALLMLNAEGQPDAQFGNNGVVTTHVVDAENYLFDLEVFPNNYIVAVGYAASEAEGTKIIAARYNSSGTLDLDFGNNNVGYELLGIDDVEMYAVGVGVQASSEGYVIGGYSNVSGSYNFCAARLHGGFDGLEAFKENNAQLHLWPNPVEDELHIELSDANNALSYTVSDMSGCVTLSGNWPQDNYISTESLASGVYFLNVKTEISTHQIKFIKIN